MILRSRETILEPDTYFYMLAFKIYVAFTIYTYTSAMIIIIELSKQLTRVVLMAGFEITD